MIEPYRHVVRALRGLEFTVWNVVDSLVADVPVNDNGIVPNGVWPDLMLAVHDAGIVNPSTGDPYSLSWFQRLHSLGRWMSAAPNPALKGKIRNYPVRVVMEARGKAEGDHERALALLAENPKLHDLAGTSPGGRVTLDSVLRDTEQLTQDERNELVMGVITTQVREGNRQHRQTLTREQLNNPTRAYQRLGSYIADVSVSVRKLGMAYQEFKALVSDEDTLGAAEERLAELRAEVDRSLGEIVSGSYEEALARITEGG